MGGGSKDKNVKDTIPPPVNQLPGGIQGYTTLDPFMPGMDQALANQLSQGYGGNPNDVLKAFQQYYAPMKIPSYNKPGGTQLPPGITPLPIGEDPVVKNNQGGGDGFNPEARWMRRDKNGNYPKISAKKSEG